MVSSIEALLTGAPTEEQDMQALAQQLRGQQSMGDAFQLSPTERYRVMGKGLSTGATKSASDVGGLKRAAAKAAENKRRWEQERAELERERSFNRAFKQEGRSYDRGKIEHVTWEGPEGDVTTFKKDAQGNLFTTDGVPVPPEILEDMKKYKQFQPRNLKSGRPWSKPAEYVNKSDPKNVQLFQQNPDGRVVDNEGNPVDLNEWVLKQKGKVGSGGKGGGKVTAAMKKGLAKTGDAGGLVRMLDEFKPEFAGSGWPYLGTVQNKLSRISPILASQPMKDQQRWWRNFGREFEAIERHALFGATLAKGEAGAWADITLNPNMDAGQMEQGIKDIMDSLRDDVILARDRAIAEGMDPQRLNGYLRDIAEKTGIDITEPEAEGDGREALDDLDAREAELMRELEALGGE